MARSHHSIAVWRWLSLIISIQILLVPAMVLVLLSLVLSIRIHFSAGICLRPHQNAVKYNDCIQLKFKTWKMCVCVCICVAMGCDAKWNRKSIGFILIKLKSNFSLSRLHSSIFPIIRRFTIFIELNCCASGYCSVFFMQSMHVRSHHISHSNGCNRRFTQWIHKSRNAKIDFSNLFFINCSIPAESFMHLIWN